MTRLLIVWAACLTCFCFLTTWGCAVPAPAPEPQKVLVPCTVPSVDKPVWARDKLVDTSTPYERVRAAYVELEQRVGYELGLEASLQACQ